MAPPPPEILGRMNTIVAESLVSLSPTQSPAPTPMPNGVVAHPSASPLGSDFDAKEDTVLMKHRTYPWVMVEPLDVSRDMVVKEVVERHGVPSRVVECYLRKEIVEEASFRSLPFAVFLVVIFALMYINHDEAYIVRDQEDAIMHDIIENANFAWSEPLNIGHKSKDDVNSFPDFYSFIRLGMVPLMLPKEWVLSELFTPHINPPQRPLEAYERDEYLHYNRIFGGIRLEQELTQPRPCKNSRLAATYGKPCYPTEEVTPLDINLQPEAYDILVTAGNYDPEWQVWFRSSDADIKTIIGQLEDLELSGWINDATVRARISALFYNPHFQLLTLNQVNFYFTRSGHVWKQIINESLTLEPYGWWMNWVFDIIFAACITAIFLSELQEVFSLAKLECWAKGPSRFLWDYLSFWNTIDWLSIIWGYVLIGMWCSLCVSMYGFRADMLGLGDQNSDEYMPRLNSFLRRFEDATLANLNFRYVAAGYPMIIVARLFKAFSAQARLTLVTRTLWDASTDAFHFGIVFACIFLTFAVMGVALFGAEVQEFATIMRSTSACFRALFGDIDRGAMMQVGRAFTALWFWSFFVLVLLVMLNMLLAIIMDAYEKVSQQVQSAETIWEQAYELVRRHRDRRKGKRVSIQHMHRCLHHWMLQDILHEHEVLALPDFCAVVDGLENAQALRILSNSVNEYRHNHEDSLSISQAMAFISQIHRDVSMLIIHCRAKVDEAASAKQSRQSSPHIADRSRTNESRQTIDASAMNGKVACDPGHMTLPGKEQRSWSPRRRGGSRTGHRSLQGDCDDEVHAEALDDIPRELAQAYSLPELFEAAHMRVMRMVVSPSSPSRLPAEGLGKLAATLRTAADVSADSDMLAALVATSRRLMDPQFSQIEESSISFDAEGLLDSQRQRGAAVEGGLYLSGGPGRPTPRLNGLFCPCE